jgi:hypothetical protein
MKSLFIIALTITAFLLLPVLAYAQTYEATSAGPPIEQPLVREGTLAVALAGALQVGQTTSEVDAESLLGGAGIAPRNGWIADYPVTPDIAAELRAAVADAATAGSLAMGEDEALTAYDDIMTRYNLWVKPDSSGQTEGDQSAPSYADAAATDNYYSDYGPPVVTYYAPPVDYAYLYSWVPYPFWWWNVWFPGFFVLVDFNVPVFVGGHVCFVSNHVFDRHHSTFVRINASDRFHSSTSVSRATVVGPTAVSTGGQTTFKRFRSRAVNRGFLTDGNVRMTRFPSRNRNAVSEGGSTVTTVPNRGTWVGQRNRAYGSYPASHRGIRSGRSAADNSAFGRGSAISRQFERPTRDRNAVSEGGSTVTTVPNRSAWSGQRNRAYGSYSPSYRSNTSGTSVAGTSAFGTGRAMGRQFERPIRTYVPPARSHSALAPQQVSPMVSSGRPFEVFSRGAFGRR